MCIGPQGRNQWLEELKVPKEDLGYGEIKLQTGAYLLVGRPGFDCHAH